MSNVDPRLPLNCPYCGKRPEYRETIKGVHIYQCFKDGRLFLYPDGRFIKDERMAE